MSTTTTDQLAASLDELKTADQLFAALARIDVEGWDGPTGQVVLEYARTKVVGPAVRAAGCTGAEVEYAEATGWAAAWDALRRRNLRNANSPWGVVNQAVRAAVINERMAEIYGTDARSAWRIQRFTTAGARRARGDWKSVADPAALRRPVSLDTLLERGIEPTQIVEADAPTLQLDPIVALLVRHGWDAQLAQAAVLHIAEHARPNPGGSPKAHGWPEMALDLGIHGWQARRVTVLLLGSGDWPGVVERLARGGESALTARDVEAAARATCDRTIRPAAKAAVDVQADRLPALAS
jgi:hypothetical protein